MAESQFGSDNYFLGTPLPDKDSSKAAFKGTGPMNRRRRYVGLHHTTEVQTNILTFLVQCSSIEFSGNPGTSWISGIRSTQWHHAHSCAKSLIAISLAQGAELSRHACLDDGALAVLARKVDASVARLLVNLALDPSIRDPGKFQIMHFSVSFPLSNA